jgi:mono/diheme cytochrome c family protein
MFSGLSAQPVRLRLEHQAMSNHPQARTRRIIGLTASVAAIVAVGYLFTPGIPVLWGPSASAASLEAGAMLFEHEWEPNDSLAHGDGLGPVFNARSCVACHFQGGVGGGGSADHNVTSFEVHPTKRNPDLLTGIVHAASVNPDVTESVSFLQERFPVIKGGTRNVVQGGCASSVIIPDINPVNAQSVNSTALFGAGWVDRMSPRAITANRWSNTATSIVKEFQADWSAVPAGRPRILPDGRVGKFGWKGQAATLEEFVAAACANEIGLGNPLMSQATPLTCQASAKVEPDLDRKQFNALVAFVDTLPRPREVTPAEPYHRAAAIRGKEVFSSVGCAICHTQDLGGVTGVYSDFLLHTVEGSDNPQTPGGGYGDNPDELPLPPDFPKASEWKTPPLWGVADSAPYFHDGASPTLKDAVLRHRADGKAVTEAFLRLPASDQEALFAFLSTLKAPSEARTVTKYEQIALRGR